MIVQLLGRASDIQGFVKLGKKTGFVELELKSPPGKPNLVIRRNLNANSKSSQYLINGKSASGRDVNQRIQELNIQVSNLWCVLSYFADCCPLMSRLAPFFPKTELQSLPA